MEYCKLHKTCAASNGTANYQLSDYLPCIYHQAVTIVFLISTIINRVYHNTQLYPHISTLTKPATKVNVSVTIVNKIG